MAANIEIKAPLADRAGVQSRLRDMCADEQWTRRQLDTFFSVPRGWLKLREEDGRVELIAYTRSTDNAGPRASDYQVLPVHDAAAMSELLARVAPVDAVVEKQRTMWLWRHTRIHLDRVAGLGDFLELETVVDGIMEEAAMAECDEVIAALALDRSTFLAVPYRDLIAV